MKNPTCRGIDNKISEQLTLYIAKELLLDSRKGRERERERERERGKRKLRCLISLERMSLIVLEAMSKKKRKKVL